MQAETGGILLAGSVFLSCGLGFLFENESIGCISLGICFLCMGLFDAICRRKS